MRRGEWNGCGYVEVGWGWVVGTGVAEGMRWGRGR